MFESLETKNMTRSSSNYRYDKSFRRLAARILNETGYRESARKRDIYLVRKWTVIESLKPEANKSKLARVIGVSRQTVYNWLHRFRQGGVDALRPKSRRPKNIQRCSREEEKRVVALRRHKNLGCEKIAFDCDISSMSVYRILKKHKMVQKVKKTRRKWKYFERKHANSMWQIDLKVLYNRLWTISILDDHSRFIVGFKIVDYVPRSEDVIKLLEQGIRQYGKPREILTDHGPQFFSARNGISNFTVWCFESNIRHILAGVKKPTTIGKVEAWNKSLEYEFLPEDDEIPEEKLVSLAEEFVWFHNYERPHFRYELFTFRGVVKRRKIQFIPYLRFVNHRKNQPVKLLCKRPCHAVSVKHVLL